MRRRMRHLVPLLLAGLLSLVLPRAELAHAASFLVATTTDAPHTTPVDGNCTSTLSGNPCTLRAAVQAANFLGGGPHTITLPAGTYTLTVVGPNELAAATGDLNIRANVVILGAGPSNTVVDGNGTDRGLALLGTIVPL